MFINQEMAMDLAGQALKQMQVNPKKTWDATTLKSCMRSMLSGITPTMPEIVCLCGPLRFMDAFRQAEYDLEMQGKIVVAPSFLPGAAKHDGLTGCTPEEKIMLDELHKRKIDLCDTILVLNIGGYIGDSTRSEIEYAEKTGKPVYYLEARLNYPECINCICSKCNDDYCKTEACSETCIHYGKAYPSEHCQNPVQC